jgi:hypothetical protein
VISSSEMEELLDCSPHIWLSEVNASILVKANTFYYYNLVFNIDLSTEK